MCRPEGEEMGRSRTRKTQGSRRLRSISTLCLKGALRLRSLKGTELNDPGHPDLRSVNDSTVDGQNEELISDRWVKIADQPEVRVMQLTKQDEPLEREDEECLRGDRLELAWTGQPWKGEECRLACGGHGSGSVTR